MLPRSTDGMQAIKGSARMRPEDTQLEEVLRRPPDGGDHFWVKVRLRGLSRAQAQAAIARAAGVDPSLVCSAGGRDRHAIVQQWLTLPKAAVENPPQIRGAGYKQQLKVLEVHEGAGAIEAADVVALRCRLRLHQAADAFTQAQELLRHLRQEGVPNYFPSRLQGPKGSHARWGRLLAQGRRLPGGQRCSTYQRLEYERAWQARLFNAWLARRMQCHGLRQVLSGDWLQMHLQLPVDQQASQLVADPQAVQERVNSWESVVMGPLFGASLPAAQAEAADLEAAVLEQMGPPPSDQCRGGRRALRFQPRSAQLEISQQDLLLSCLIPLDASVAALAEEFLHPPGHLP